MKVRWRGGGWFLGHATTTNSRAPFSFFYSTQAAALVLRDALLDWGSHMSMAARRVGDE